VAGRGSVFVEMDPWGFQRTNYPSSHPWLFSWDVFPFFQAQGLAPGPPFPAPVGPGLRFFFHSDHKSLATPFICEAFLLFFFANACRTRSGSPPVLIFSFFFLWRVLFGGLFWFLLARALAPRRTPSDSFDFDLLPVSPSRFGTLRFPPRDFSHLGPRPFSPMP